MPEKVVHLARCKSMSSNNLEKQILGFTPWNNRNGKFRAACRHWDTMASRVDGDAAPGHSVKLSLHSLCHLSSSVIAVSFSHLSE